ncbi:MAG: beta-ketoacyl synthase [Legionellaceae bacterium]|nr:beta-ketoacyl synthase [Legionellaceae bacterium]
MIKLPVIVGMGGMNAAGRSSGFHSYKRLVSDVLSDDAMESTWLDLGRRMGMSIEGKPTAEQIEAIKNGTLVRRIERFDPDNVLCHQKAKLDTTGPDATGSFVIKKSKLPEQLPESYRIEEIDQKYVRVTVKGEQKILLPDHVRLPVSSGGGLPAGFDLGALYKSHHHPRGLQLSVYGISDALNSMGVEWDEVLEHIKPDQVAVYAGSAISQVDEHSLAGVIAQPLLGKRINSKMMALSLSEMPADFVNSYVINSVGMTGHNVGACATFLYNLKQGLESIQSGQARVAIVGGVEAPIVPEIVEGFRVMSALATDKELMELDGLMEPNNRRACRPFSTNAGFTLAEASQFVVLMDDELALELGARVYGSVADVFIHADANKKSISGPGVGNYITVAKAAALAKSILGQDGLEQTYVQAHGTGTPQNRVTESHILNEVAKTFSIKSWPVAAIKSYIGHTVSAAAGDQLIASLGVWQHGWVPGIKTIDHIADDVHDSNLDILMDHLPVGAKGEDMKAVVLNSKGFGGNNASSLILSPHQTMDMLKKKHGQAALDAYSQKHTHIQQRIDELDAQGVAGDERIIYKFGESVMDETSVSITPSELKLSEFKQAIPLPTVNPYSDYCES